MLKAPGAATAFVCVAVLAAYGSTAASHPKSAAIATKLHQLQGHIKNDPVIWLYRAISRVTMRCSPDPGWCRDLRSVAWSRRTVPPVKVHM